MTDFDLRKITGREPPIETDEDMMNALADALGDADALRTERDALRARVSELEAAGRAVLNCNDQVCAFGHGGCPAQCRADEMLRKAIRCAGNKGESRDGT